MDLFRRKIKTAVIWHKSTSKFKPDYSVDYLKDFVDTYAFENMKLQI